MIIEKKVIPKYFQPILDGLKNYEYRLGDFECNPDDILLLKEFDPEKKDFTGRSVQKTITYIGKGSLTDFLMWPKEDIEKYGLQIISFK
jgi:hypothetical protein